MKELTLNDSLLISNICIKILEGNESEAKLIMNRFFEIEKEIYGELDTTKLTEVSSILRHVTGFLSGDNSTNQGGGGAIQKKDYATKIKAEIAKEMAIVDKIKNLKNSNKFSQGTRIELAQAEGRIRDLQRKLLRVTTGSKPKM
jgi:hypothetical protein